MKEELEDLVQRLWCRIDALTERVEAVDGRIDSMLKMWATEHQVKQLTERVVEMEEQHKKHINTFRYHRNEIDDLYKKVETLAGDVRKSDPPKPAEPEGVYVRPGMSVEGRMGTRTVAPKFAGGFGDIVNSITVYDSEGGYLWGEARHYTYKGQPVLGYEEDKP